jgi:archaellum component FlaC
MANRDTHLRLVESTRDFVDEAEHRLKGGGGGGTFDDMEARVKALEDKFDRIDGKLDRLVNEAVDLKVAVAKLTGRVDSMPSSLQLLAFAIAVFVAAGLLKYLAP